MARLAGCVCVLSLAWFARAEPTDEPKRGLQTAEWRPLFNGKNLDGWYLFLQKSPRDQDPTRVVTIEEGAIHAYKHDRNGAEVVMGYLGTKEEFSNYHVRFEYRWGKNQFKPRYLYKPDAGVYFHHVTEDLVWPQALQCQVELNGVGDLLTVGRIQVDTTVDPKTKTDEWQEYLDSEKGGVAHTTKGQGVSYTRKRENHERDGWNQVDVICQGTAAAILVNGHLVTRCSNIRQQDPTDPSRWVPLDKGRILLEFEATEMYYRNIAIRQLSASETLADAIGAAGR